jgi:hypothetical protein
MDNDKIEQAVRYITSCCRRMGAFFGTSEVARYLHTAAMDMNSAAYSDLFGLRLKEHVAYAVALLSQYSVLEPPAALASVFLATRFEIYFRLLSDNLNPDGSWKSREAQNFALARTTDNRLKRSKISSVELTYRILLLDEDKPLVEVFRKVDHAIQPSLPSADSPVVYTDIGSRIKCFRDPASHGFYSDLSAEGNFYALLTAIIFYSQSDQA